MTDGERIIMHYAQQQQYLKVRVETAGPGDLTLLLYQEIVKSLLLAKKLYSQNQFEAMNEPLYKARAILNELTVTLNMDYDIAKNLRSLYEFYYSYIAEFIIKKDESMLDHMLDFARDMVHTWSQALRSLKSAGVQANG